MSREEYLNDLTKKLIYGNNESILEKIDGIWVLSGYKAVKNTIDNLEVYDDDVWVCTFPKSGTTWMQEMVWLIKNDLDYKGAEIDLEARFPFLEISAFFKASTPEDLIPSFLRNSIQYVQNFNRPRLIKTHLPWQLLPKQIQTGERKPKIIYVSRNPKDACISYYHHMKLFKTFTGTFDEMAQLYYGDRLSFMPYWNHVLTYYNMKLDNVFCIKFEDMKSDLKLSVIKVATFLEHKIADEDMDKLVHHLSFEQMKLNPAVNKNAFLDVLRSLNMDVTGSFMRSGKSGNYKDEMDEKINKAFDEWINENIKDTDFVL